MKEAKEGKSSAHVAEHREATDGKAMARETAKPSGAANSATGTGTAGNEVRQHSPAQHRTSPPSSLSSHPSLCLSLCTAASNAKAPPINRSDAKGDVLREVEAKKNSAGAKKGPK